MLLTLKLRHDPFVPHVDLIGQGVHHNMGEPIFLEVGWSRDFRPSWRLSIPENRMDGTSGAPMQLAV